MKRIFTATLGLLIAVVAQASPKYVFLFIGDGMGVNQVNGTEMYLAEKNEGKIGVEPLLFTQFPVASFVTTYSSTNSVTDSSAGGTALATGKKTYNGAISVDLEKQPVTTVAERAKRSGKRVGVVTSVSVDHATPAAFYAHQPNRGWNYEIARDLVTANFDFYGGSGFLKPTTSHDKKESPSIFPMYEEAGYTIARGYNDYKAKAPDAKKMILIQEEGKKASQLPFAMDRRDDDLSLAQLTQSAIEFLSRNNKNGFFLMVEGGLIDWACHANDGAAVFSEVKDMDNAVRVAYEFYKAHPKETLIVITADHETGGLVMGNGAYALNLKALASQKQSVDGLSARISELRKSKENHVKWEEMKELLGEEMGFWKEIPLKWEQERALRDEFERSFVKNKVAYAESLYSKSEPMAALAKNILNEIAMLTWGTTNHSAGYVPVYAIGEGAEAFGHKIDNTEIPLSIAREARYK